MSTSVSAPAASVTVACPSCDTPFSTPVHLDAQVLRARRCSTCGHRWRPVLQRTPYWTRVALYLARLSPAEAQIVPLQAPCGACGARESHGLLDGRDPVCDRCAIAYRKDPERLVRLVGRLKRNRTPARRPAPAAQEVA